MTVRDRWMAWREARKRTQKEQSEAQRPPLRDFVYLDEASLQSLLSSAAGEMTDQKSEQLSEGLESEVTGSAAVGNAVIAKADISSRFQTTNSRTTQTSRKATVQSWFRDFHRIPGLRIVEPVSSVQGYETKPLAEITNMSLVAASSELKRGELVEFRVTLAAEPVFRLSTIFSEYMDMVDANPSMFTELSGVAAMRDLQQVNKILEHLLVGLVPIKSVATDYSVIEINGEQHMVHNGLLPQVGCGSVPLQIVGVTEQLAYWKDLRRVLFSDAGFTLLGRISHSGIVPSWTPVKLADLFGAVVPDFAESLDMLGRLPLTSRDLPVPTAYSELLGKALRYYADTVLAELAFTPDEGQQVALTVEIAELQSKPRTSSDQRAAFAAVGAMLKDWTGQIVDAQRDLELRERARVDCGLPALPSVEAGTAPSLLPARPAKSECLLEVEVVAIYW